MFFEVFRQLFCTKKGKHMSTFSSLRSGSRPERPDPTKKVRIRNTASRTDKKMIIVDCLVFVASLSYFLTF
jgi:hypothetical protein